MRSDVPSWSRKSFVPSGSEGMLPEGGKLSYFVSGTEPQPASSQPPESVNQRHFLRGGDALAITGVVVSIFALILAATARITPLEATIQMERLAKKIESAKSFDAGVADEIDRLMERSEYDCLRVVCSAELRLRNSAARTKLRTIVARKMMAREMTDTATTGSTDMPPP